MAEYTDLESILTSPSTGDTVPASWFDAVRDNFAMIFGIAAAQVLTTQTTTSSSYTDLSTVGPSVTVDTGDSALVLVSALVLHNTNAGTCLMTHAVSGATSLSASDDWRGGHQFPAATNAAANILGIGIHDGTLTPGQNTFTAKYRTSGGGTASFSVRKIIVIPLA